MIGTIQRRFRYLAIISSSRDGANLIAVQLILFQNREDSLYKLKDAAPDAMNPAPLQSTVSLSCRTCSPGQSVRGTLRNSLVVVLLVTQREGEIAQGFIGINLDAPNFPSSNNGNWGLCVGLQLKRATIQKIHYQPLPKSLIHLKVNRSNLRKFTRDQSIIMLGNLLVQLLFNQMTSMHAPER